MAEDIAKLQQMRAKADAAGDHAAVTRIEARIARAGMELQGQDQARQQQGDEPAGMNLGLDVIRAVVTGLRGAAEGTVGMPQDIADLVAAGVGKMTGTRPNLDIPFAPSSDEVNQFTSGYVGESYQPQIHPRQICPHRGRICAAAVQPIAGRHQGGQGRCYGHHFRHRLGSGWASNRRHGTGALGQGSGRHGHQRGQRWRTGRG